MRVIAYLAVVCAGGTWLPAAAAAGENPQPPRRGWMQAVTVDRAPPIDGVGRGGAWARCPALPLGECTTDKPGPLRTTARVLFDATHVYVSFDCAEPDTDGLVRKAGRRDGNVWADDSVEVFITGDLRRGMHQFAVNPAGVLFDARARDATWNSSARVAAKVHAGSGWTVTLAIPMKELAAYVGTNQTWIVNLNRTKPGPRANQPAGEWSWAIMGSSDYHQVMDYGQVVGVSVPRRSDGVTRTASPPPPPPTDNRGVRAGSVT
ncbi:MAG: sugar-binding protein, partial [Planctomycetota bacterium]